MASPQPPEILRTTFHERCMAMVNRGIGEIAIAPNVFVEATVGTQPEEYWFANFERKEHRITDTGLRVILHHDILLGSDYNVEHYFEAEEIDELPRPSLASEDVIKQYMLEDLTTLIIPNPGAVRLANFLHNWNVAEQLGLHAVTADEMLDTISLMDELIAAHDSPA